jgi:hypothetical protein
LPTPFSVSDPEQRAAARDNWRLRLSRCHTVVASCSCVRNVRDRLFSSRIVRADSAERPTVPTRRFSARTQGNSCRGRVFHTCGTAASVGPFMGDKGDDSKRELPLRRHPIHRREPTCGGNPLHLLLLFQARRALGLSGSEGGFRSDHSARSRLDLPVGQWKTSTLPRSRSRCSTAGKETSI